MSTICALKEGGTIVVGSDTQETQDGVALHLHAEAKWMFHGQAAISLSGEVRAFNLIQHNASDLLGDVPAPCVLAERLIGLFKGADFNPRTKNLYVPEWGSDFIYVQGNRLWDFDAFLTSSPVDRFCAKGSTKTLPGVLSMRCGHS